MAKYLLDLNVMWNTSAEVSMPNPWTRISRDLNDGAGGAFIYLFKLRGDPDTSDLLPITGLHIHEGDVTTPVPPGFVRKAVDLNKGSGGAFLYLEFTRNTGLGRIRDVDIVSGGSREEAISRVDDGWELLDWDLNKGAGGEYIYVVYKR
jgi:hypothetical protein